MYVIEISVTWRHSDFKTQVPEMDTRSELLRKLEEADIDGANTSSGVVRDSEMYEKINYIIGYVFLMFTFQMGAICGKLTAQCRHLCVWYILHR